MALLRGTGSLIAVFSLLLVGCSDDDEPKAETGFSAPSCDLSEGRRPVVPDAEGDRVAFVSCPASGPVVAVHDFETGKTTTLGDTSESASVEWLLDGRHLLVGSLEDLSVVPVDGSSEPVRVATGPVLAYRIFLQKFADTDFRPRLLVMEQDGDTRRITQRTPDDGYTEGDLIYEAPELGIDLSQLSGSGRTLILTTDEEGETGGYVKKLIDGSGKTEELPYGPKSWAMAPVGLGDTHNYALHDDTLVRIKIDKSAEYLEIVPSGSGLLEGTHHLISRESEPGFRHVYYILDGDPTRRVRQPETPGEPLPPAETIAEANAIAQLMSPDEATLLYLSDGVLYGVPAEPEGSPGPRVLVAETTDLERVRVAFSSSKKELFKKHPELAYIANETLYRVRLAGDAEGEPLSGPAADPATVVYDGDQEAILYLTADGDLARVAETETDAVTVASSVDAFWTIPDSSDVIVAIGGQLSRLTLDD